MTNFTGTVLYVGASTVLSDRIRTHQEETLPGFTKRYHCTKLIYFEICVSRDAAYRREKEIKGWTRIKKEILILAKNPEKRDLFSDLLKEVDKYS